MISNKTPSFDELQTLRRQLARLKPEDFNGKYRVAGNIELVFFYTPVEGVVRGKEDYQDRWYLPGRSVGAVHQAPNYTVSVDAAIQILNASGLHRDKVMTRVNGGAFGSFKYFQGRGFDFSRSLALSILSITLMELATVAEITEGKLEQAA